MPCFTVATGFKLASPMEMVENKRRYGKSHIATLEHSVCLEWRMACHGFWDTICVLADRGAFGVGLAGRECARRQSQLASETAGIRTHALVSLSTALVTLITFESTGHALDATSRVVQGLVTGIGFLGAGVIIHYDAEHRVEGLTTAATVWLTAIFGIACGMGQGSVVLVGLVFALGVLICGLPVERAMARWLNRGDNVERDQ